MNTVIEKCRICHVDYLPTVIGKRWPGQVTCGSDSAWFLFEDSHDVVIREGEITFGTGKANLLHIGDEVVARMERRGSENFVTAWTTMDEFKSAMKKQELEVKAEMPKPAPTLPIAPAEIIRSKLDKPNQTGKDRRPIFVPSKRRKKTPVVPFEQKLEAAAAEQVAAEQAAS